MQAVEIVEEVCTCGRAFRAERFAGEANPAECAECDPAAWVAFGLRHAETVLPVAEDR